MKPLPKMVPHTQAKHILLTKYLGRWFPILGKYHKRINYIDGFAGPDEYLKGEPGSPSLAIEAAKAHVERGSLAPDVEINFIFVEADGDYGPHLEKRLRALQVPPNFHIEILRGEFVDVIGELLDDIERRGSSLAPTFAFVDPFGFSGIPFQLMARILSFPRCEVFINIMIDFINRFIEHPNDQIVSHFPSTFGTQEVFAAANAAEDRSEALLALYRRQLTTRAKYVGRFDMHGRRDQHTYSLFFATNHVLGFTKMKEAMWSVDKLEGGKFSDFEPSASRQGVLFPYLSLAEQLKSKFTGRRVLMAELERFVVEETDYLPTHARSVLSRLEGTEASVEMVKGHKRHGKTYPSDKCYIEFHELLF